MILISKKKIEAAVTENNVTMKQLVIYFYLSTGSMFSLFRVSKYLVVSNEYLIAQLIVFATSLVWIIGFIKCFTIIREKDVHRFAYSIIPLLTVLKIRFGLFIMIPMIIINIYFIKVFKLKFAYWNAINAQAISFIVSLITVITFLKSIKKIFSER